jgi:hypothetical protein
MIMNTMLRWLAPGLALMALSAAPMGAQETPAETPQPVSTDSVELVFEREVFFYPQYERRDPFAPLISGDETGPRFEELELLGIIYYPAPGESVALLGPRAEQAQDQTAIRTYRVRSGDQLGNIRILQIQETRIVVEIEEFGMREQRIMELVRPGQGGLS